MLFVQFSAETRRAMSIARDEGMVLECRGLAATLAERGSANESLVSVRDDVGVPRRTSAPWRRLCQGVATTLTGTARPSDMPTFLSVRVAATDWDMRACRCIQQNLLA